MFRGIFGLPGGTGYDLITATILNRGSGCNPILGLGRLSWSVSSVIPYPASYIELEYDVGSGFTPFASNIDPALPYYDFDLSLEPGFSSLDLTDFQVSWIAGVIPVSGSPKLLVGPYGCL